MDESLQKLDPEAGTPDPSVAHDGPEGAEAPALPPRRVNWAQVTILILGSVAFLYFARPVLLPVVLAWMCATALRPFVRWLTLIKFSTPVAAAVVFCLLLTLMGVGVVQIERPAAQWINDAPQHMTVIRQRFLRLFPKALHLSEAADAMTQIATPAPGAKNQENVPVVEVREPHRGAGPILNWTGTLLAGLLEVLVLTYLLLAAGDLFLQKIVRVTPTLRGKIQAVEISNEIQQGISLYLFSISIINVVLGTLLAAAFSLLGVPNGIMWGVLAAVLNFVPYFGPICGVILLAAVGLLTFDSPIHGLLPPGIYLLLHLVESNFVTPILLGRRFTLNPVAIFVSLIFWLWLWGVPGALLAVPVLVSIKVMCDHIPALSYFGELIGR
jgi:predicted PurR-regulated permease PerM